MATIKITVLPKATDQRKFNASQLAVAIDRKRPQVPYSDDREQFIEDLWEEIASKVRGSVNIDGTMTGNIPARLREAKIKKFLISGSIVPGGRSLVMVRVLTVDDEDLSEEDTVTLFITVDETLEEPEDTDMSFEDLMAEGKVTFASPRVKRAVEADPKAETKAVSIYERGTSYRGHGPTADLGGALHAHIEGRTALGFKWMGNALQLVAYGVKSDSAGTGTSGYTWTR